MKVILVSKCSLDIEQYVEFKISVLISPSKSLISSRWVTILNSDLSFQKKTKKSLLVTLPLVTLHFVLQRRTQLPHEKIPLLEHQSI